VVERVFQAGLVVTRNSGMRTPASDAGGFRCIAALPLRLIRYVEHRDEGQIIGVLYLDAKDEPTAMSASALATLETLSDEAALAIENARLYRETLDKAKFQQELKVAAAIQQSLLPPMTRSGSFFTIAAASVPCRAIGGDFFDYVDLPTGGFGFIVGDVAGKGSPAALLAATMLGMFVAESVHPHQPAELTTRLNRYLFRRAVEARFVTAVYMTLSPEGIVTYANGGNIPPLLVSESGVSELQVEGMVIGLFEHATFEQAQVQMKSGDSLVAFSDGIPEALNAAGDEFGHERLVGAVREHYPATAQAVVDTVLARVREFCAGADQSDDLTIVVLRYDG
jgi:serine phosphatase RsbU (regulator of sigma subunit)